MSDDLTPDQVADRLGVTRHWVMRRAAAKKIPHYKVGRFYRFTEDDVTAIKAAGRVEPAASGNGWDRKGRGAA